MTAYASDDNEASLVVLALALPAVLSITWFFFEKHPKIDNHTNGGDILNTG